MNLVERKIADVGHSGRFSPPVSTQVRTFRHSLLMSVAASLCLFGGVAGAQASAQPVSPVTVTPQTLAPADRTDGFAVDIPDAGALQPPPGSDALSVTLGEVVIDGTFPEVSGSVGGIVDRLRGRRVTLTEVFAAASDIEAAHARAGYVLARVTVPPQQLVDGGVLHLVVTDGFIEEIDTSALSPRARQATADRVAALKGKTKIQLSDIEEALSLAADLPGLALRSTLMRGTQPAAARLVLEGDQRLLTGVIGVDNQLDPSLGRWGVNLQLVLNSALGLGEQFYGFAASDYDVSHIFDERPRQRVLGGGVILPFDLGRFSINPEVTFATTTPDVGPGVLATRGLLRRISLRGQAIVQKARRKDVRLGLTLEQVDVRNEALGFATRINHDRYVAARLGGTVTSTSGAGVRTNATLQLSKGLGSAGGISVSDTIRSGTPFSRVGAKPDFIKLAAGGRAVVPLNAALQLSVSANAQTSFGKPVFRSEQFSLEGSDALSAYLGGETAVDTGIASRVELSYLNASGSTEPSAFAVSPYAFLAFGSGRLEAPTAVERGSISAFNFGAGLRARLFERLDVRLEYARSASSVPALDNIDRVGVSAAVQF